MTRSGGGRSYKVALAGLGVSAEPVRFLDYLFGDTQLAAVPTSAGLLIRLPDPARFALHKLVVARSMPEQFLHQLESGVAQLESRLRQRLDFLASSAPGGNDEGDATTKS